MQFKTTVRLVSFQLQIVQETFSRKPFEWPYFEYRGVSYTTAQLSKLAAVQSEHACILFQRSVSCLLKYYAHTWCSSPQSAPGNLNGSEAAGADRNISRIVMNDTGQCKAG